MGLVEVDPVIYAMQRRVPVLASMAGMARLNVDGALAVRNPTAEGLTHGYSQFFRNGFLESVMVIGTGHDGRPALPSLRYERQLIEFLEQVRAEMVHLGISGDMAVMLSILRANEVQLGVNRDRDFFDAHQGRFDRRTLVLPDVLTQADVAPELALKPVFDLVWQSAGFNGSHNYNDQGQWAPRA